MELTFLPQELFFTQDIDGFDDVITHMTYKVMGHVMPCYAAEISPEDPVYLDVSNLSHDTFIPWIEDETDYGQAIEWARITIENDQELLDQIVAELNVVIDKLKEDQS